MGGSSNPLSGLTDSLGELYKQISKTPENVRDLILDPITGSAAEKEFPGFKGDDSEDNPYGVKPHSGIAKFGRLLLREYTPQDDAAGQKDKNNPLKISRTTGLNPLTFGS